MSLTNIPLYFQLHLELCRWLS